MKNISEKKAKFWVIILISIFIIGAVIFTVIILSNPQPYETTTYSMGTYVQQTLYGSGSEKAAALAANRVAELEDLISWKKVDSEIAAINENAGNNWTAVSETTANILENALSVCKESGGAFDITIAPLSALWDFDNSPTAPPSDESIQKFLPKIDYTQLREDKENSSFSLKSSGYAVDLGAVGKGAACDEAVNIYKTTGVDYGIIAVGGSIGTFGSKPFGQKWSIAVRNPEGGDSVGTISIQDGFVSTSGNYEKYFEYNGERFHHILDPKTGYPAKNNLTSVTIICESGVISDSLSTACFVMGFENSQQILSKFNAYGIFVFEDKSVKLSQGAENIFTLTNGEYRLEK